jgi:hypothetical protein
MEGLPSLLPNHSEAEAELVANFDRLQPVASHVDLDDSVPIVGDRELALGEDVVGPRPAFPHHAPDREVVEVHLVEVTSGDGIVEFFGVLLSQHLRADNLGVRAAYPEEDLVPTG